MRWRQRQRRAQCREGEGVVRSSRVAVVEGVRDHVGVGVGPGYPLLEVVVEGVAGLNRGRSQTQVQRLQG